MTSSNGTRTNETLVAALRTHIKTEVTHYKGQCYAWDVVNEALNDNETFGSDIFLDIIGPAYIQIAFETAAAADSNVKLYYNDFGTEFVGPKSTAALNIVKSLKADGVKIDGVGFQSHLSWERHRPLPHRQRIWNLLLRWAWKLLSPN